MGLTTSGVTWNCTPHLSPPRALELTITDGHDLVRKLSRATSYYDYELLIKETEPPPDLADAPAVFRDLVDVVSKEKVAPGTTFEMRLTTVFPDSQIVANKNTRIIMQDAPERFAFFKDTDWYGEDFGREFTCEPMLCEEMSTLVEQDLALTLEFAHPASSSEPLLLKRIVKVEALPDLY